MSSKQRDSEIFAPALEAPAAEPVAAPAPAPPTLADRIRMLGTDRQADSVMVDVLLAMESELAALRQK